MTRVNEKLAWREDKELLSKLKNGIIEGKEINFEDNYPTLVSADKFKIWYSREL